MNLVFEKSTAKKSLVPAFLAMLLTGPVHGACSANIQLTKPDNIYADNFDGTVTDSETGLIWAKCSLGQSWAENTPDYGLDDACFGAAATYTWKTALEAAKAANGSSYLGKADWRLPNKNELESLVEAACVDPSININLFSGTASGAYWTASSTTGFNHGASWIVDFNTGYVLNVNKGSGLHVRVVRGGQ